MMMESLNDYVKEESFFCEGVSLSADRGGPRSSHADTSIAPAGRLLLGLETVACTREDVEADRYTKAYLAFKPDPNSVSRGYMIGAYVHMKNKEAADRLLDQIAQLIKPLN